MIGKYVEEVVGIDAWSEVVEQVLRTTVLGHYFYHPVAPNDGFLCRKNRSGSMADSERSMEISYNNCYDIMFYLVYFLISAQKM